MDGQLIYDCFEPARKSAVAIMEYIEGLYNTDKLTKEMVNVYLENINVLKNINGARIEILRNTNAPQDVINSMEDNNKDLIKRCQNCYDMMIQRIREQNGDVR